MSDFSKTLKEAFMRSVKFVGRNASKAASATKFKTNELSKLSKRRDLIHELGIKVYDLSRNGLQLPEDADALVKQIATLDSELMVLRSEHAAEKAAISQKVAAEKAARVAEKAAAKAAAAIEKSTESVSVEFPEMELLGESELKMTPVVPQTAGIESNSNNCSSDNMIDNQEQDIPTLNF